MSTRPNHPQAPLEDATHHYHPMHNPFCCQDYDALPAGIGDFVARIGRVAPGVFIWFIVALVAFWA